MNNIECILILDVGKTHSKVTLVNLDSGHIVTSNHLNNKTKSLEKYQSLDLDRIWNWFLLQVIEFNNSFKIRQITVTTHGAAAAVLDDNGLLFPVIDYEYDNYSEINKDYENIKPHYSETGCLDLPQGLNLGRQLFFLQQTFPQRWQSAQQILMLPQYFCWKLTGIPVSEITSLGCHTDLWNTSDNKFSSLVEKCQWLDLFPAMKKSGDILGTITNNISEQTGLDESTVVLNGIHDSNASLVPYLQNNSQNLNVISSGTWAVLSSIKKHQSRQDEAKLSTTESTTNILMHSMDYQHNPVTTMRFMGGREWEVIQNSAIDECSLDDIEQIIQSRCYAIPAFTNAGPFANNNGHIIGKVNTPAQRSALATIYIALMSRYCLDILDCKADIIVEGSFTNNLLYLQLLQCLSPNESVLFSTDTSGTTYGASRLSANSKNWTTINLESVKNINLPGLSDYFQQWLLKLPELIT